MNESGNPHVRRLAEAKHWIDDASARVEEAMRVIDAKGRFPGEGHAWAMFQTTGAVNDLNNAVRDLSEFMKVITPLPDEFLEQKP
jgi:hypothetical protein